MGAIPCGFESHSEQKFSYKQRFNLFFSLVASIAKNKQFGNLHHRLRVFSRVSPLQPHKETTRKFTLFNIATPWLKEFLEVISGTWFRLRGRLARNTLKAWEREGLDCFRGERSLVCRALWKSIPHSPWNVRRNFIILNWLAYLATK